MPDPAGVRACIARKPFREDLQAWVRYDRRIALKVLNLMEDVMRHPFTGKGKPEPLKHLPGNVWSRRITQEDRLVYRVYDNTVDFLQARYHY
ncbi:MAG: Txe/YoeB family addiction module toxin [Opitutales bacterium]